MANLSISKFSQRDHYLQQRDIEEILGTYTLYTFTYCLFNISRFKKECTKNKECFIKFQGTFCHLFSRPLSSYIQPNNRRNSSTNWRIFFVLTTTTTNSYNITYQPNQQFLYFVLIFVTVNRNQPGTSNLFSRRTIPAHGVPAPTRTLIVISCNSPANMVT